jgi:hypothetical protein
VGETSRGHPLTGKTVALFLSKAGVGGTGIFKKGLLQHR